MNPNHTFQNSSQCLERRFLIAAPSSPKAEKPTRRVRKSGLASSVFIALICGNALPAAIPSITV